jgi:hypothetical protein
VVRITPDVGRNILFLELSGRPTEAEVALVEGQLTEVLARLKPPFDVVSDVRRLESLDALPLPDATRVASLLAKTRVRRVVRVVGKSSAAAMQMERVARVLGHSAHLAFSPDEAVALLSPR